MDTAAPAQTEPRRSWQSSGGESCVKGRAISRWVIVILAEYCLRFIPFKPFNKCLRAFRVGRIFKNGRVIDERFGSIRFAAHRERNVWMFRPNVLTTEVNFGGQRDVWKIEGAGLNLVRRCGVKLPA